MGFWSLTVEGLGPHDNRIPEDVEAELCALVAKLSVRHKLFHASVTCGTQKQIGVGLYRVAFTRVGEGTSFVTARNQAAAEKLQQDIKARTGETWVIERQRTDGSWVFDGDWYSDAFTKSPLPIKQEPP